MSSGHGRSLGPVGAKEVERADALESWLASYRSERSRRTMQSVLRCIIRASEGRDAGAAVAITRFEWELLADGEVFELVRGALFERYGDQSPKYLFTLRALLRHLAKAGLCDKEEVAATLELFRDRRPYADAPPLTFSDAELRRMLLACQRDPSRMAGLRDLALLALGLGTGARRSELVGVDVRDLDLRNHTVQLRVKGGGTRCAVLNKAVPDYLDAWLSRRGRDPGPLFPALRRGGHLEERHLSDHQLWKMMRSRCHEAGVEPAIRPHDLRRWYVTRLLDNGVDVFQVARAVGHARVETTFRYDRRSLEALRDTADLLTLPLFGELGGDEGTP